MPGAAAALDVLPSEQPWFGFPRTPWIFSEEQYTSVRY